MESYIIIKKDLFNISRKVKKFNKNLQVVYNLVKNRFELRKKALFGYETETVIPYDKLDYRAIIDLFKPLNIDYETVFRDIDEYNQNVESNKNEENSYVAKNKLSEIYKYGNLSKDFNSDKAFDSRWV